MDTKQQILEKKVLIFIQKLDAHKPSSEEMKNYLETYRKEAYLVLESIRDNTLIPSDGYSMGWGRGMSEYDEFGFDKDLYRAAYDVDAYYQDECITWEDTPKKDTFSNERLITK